MPNTLLDNTSRKSTRRRKPKLPSSIHMSRLPQQTWSWSTHIYSHTTQAPFPVLFTATHFSSAHTTDSTSRLHLSRPYLVHPLLRLEFSHLSPTRHLTVPQPNSQQESSTVNMSHRPQCLGARTQYCIHFFPEGFPMPVPEGGGSLASPLEAFG